jgi:drug/metabolite transporter (DMT)-like permease
VISLPRDPEDVAARLAIVMRLVAALFVVIWSTGFIVAKAIVPVADPDLFLTARFCLAAAMFLGLALAAGASWPRWRDVPRHLFAGVLLQAGYLSGTYWVVLHGLAPSVMALLGALQPMLTAVLAIFVLREIPTRRTWIGLLLGLGGVALVMVPSLMSRTTGAPSTLILVVAILAILSLTVGTVLQKTSIAAADIRASSALQNLGAAVTVGLIAWLLGESRWTPGVTLWSSLAWAALILSGVGTFLLVWMVRRGRAANVASLMLLAPPLAAVESFLLFGDRLSPVQIAGFAIALAGVFLCRPAAAARG